MQCYRCRGRVLKPTKLTAGLPAKTCAHCSGVLIDLLSYRIWRDEAPNAKSATPERFDETTVEEGKSALSCQRCSKIMLRYRIAAGHENFVDVCSTCDSVWLDRGEWDLLQHLDAEDKLTEIMTVPWQTALAAEGMKEVAREQLVAEVGAEGAAKIEAFCEWYDGLENTSAASRFLRERGIP